MTSILRINHFSVSANEAHSSPIPKYLRADRAGLAVRQLDLPGSFSPEELKQNKETWRIFQQSLIETIGQEKFDWICHRYRNRMNFSQLETLGQPLLPQHVELFSVGASQILSRDVKRSHFPEKLKTLSREDLTARLNWIQPFPIVGGYRDPLKISGSPGSYLSYLFHDKLLMDKEKQLLFSDTSRLTFPSWLERISKVTVNRELIEGQLIPAPGQDGLIDYYKVYRKVSGDGLIAYALRPAVGNSTLKPLLVFRPTQWAFSNEDAVLSYFNDVQRNVGEMGWKASEKKLKVLMSDPKFRRDDEKVTVAGYSLGGAHAQYFLAEHGDNISHAVFYADPSVDDSIAEQFAEKMNAMPRRAEPLNIQIFRLRGDFCHYVGGKHVGWGINHPDVNIQLMEIDHDNKKTRAFKLHSHRIFDNCSFPYQMQCYEDSQQLFNHLDNSKRGPDVFWYERMRRLWGGVAFISFYSISEVVNLFSSVFGIRILRSSRDPDG